MGATITQQRVKMSENGGILLPTFIRHLTGFQPGDELLLIWLPPDTIIARKLADVVADDKAFAASMQEFDQALRSAGYETAEDVLRLVEEVKREQVAEWSLG